MVDTFQFSDECITYTGFSQRCHVWLLMEIACMVVMEMSHMDGDKDDLHDQQWRCLEWPLTEMSCMDGDGDVLYGWRRILALVRADAIQSYMYFHIFTGRVALLDGTQLSFSIITIITDLYQASG